MKVLILYDYPPSPGGLATQGDMLYRGLKKMGVDVYAVNSKSTLEKEWYYNWFKPDVVTGVGYWGYAPDIILHPQKFGATAVPWLVADGYIANYQDVLNKLPLILVTSQWVKDMYVRDGISGDNIEVLPVGCETEIFHPISQDDPKVKSIRKNLGISDNQLMMLTIGGDAASKGAQEVMHALAGLQGKIPDWRYVCKVWPQDRTTAQNTMDEKLAKELGIEKQMDFQTSIISRNFVPYLISACDIYAAPARLEGFGMPQVEAGACGKPVISINAMGPKDTMIHGETALLAGVAQQIVLHETILGSESGYPENTKIKFDPPRIVDYRASIPDLKDSLLQLMNDKALRERLGKAAREHVVTNFDYMVVAQKFMQIVQKKLDLK
ncbi:glycosyltransferase family 4 protein [Oceanispirochaeta sp.]|jgi:starch synthase|uniref:glycosyltransferase family 4 protein n=1 Tax=Oceanispirochaeta sp. TaxID=2035350 RepID=UPI002606F1AE|nr:glycosyltransferase family 4 protein [Oceanispirochaeta sp.]MDA3957223.1 glycosyltransferase family 4 protein [Oceanispirochaeta sp.]